MNNVNATMSCFKDVEALVAGHDLPIGGYNEDGEFVMVCAGRTEEELGRSYQVETLQNNGWSRINTYWEDGTKEETYKRHHDDAPVVQKSALEVALEHWMKKVLASYGDDHGRGADTVRMLQDVDKIIATAFDRDPIL